MDNQLPISVWLYISLVACAQTASVGELAGDGAVTDIAAADVAAADMTIADTGPARDVPQADGFDSCAAACDRVGACFDPPAQAECMSSCASDPTMVLACEARRSDCTYPPECATNSDLQQACEAQCRALSAEECIVAYEERECIAACSDRTDARVSRFNACDSGSCDTDPCFPILVPWEPDNVDECRRGCDTMHTFDCIDASELTLCRQTCGRVTEDAAGTFDSCASGICEDDSCLVQLLLADR